MSRTRIVLLFGFRGVALRVFLRNYPVSRLSVVGGNP